MIRRIQTAAETMTNAKSVPMLTRSARNPSGASAPPTATTRPTRIVDFQGVLNRGCTAPKNEKGKRPSRAMASRMRGWLRLPTRSELVIPARIPSVTMRPGEAQPLALQGRGQRSGLVDLLVGDHAGQHGGDPPRRARCRSPALP